MDRHGEAREYLEQALALEPNNPAIIDSMGWVLFNLGGFGGGRGQLEGADGLFPEAEVAAHILGTQWALGMRVQALELLRQKLAENREGRPLKERDQRLAP